MNEKHMSDCAVYNMLASPAGKCDCNFNREYTEKRLRIKKLIMVFFCGMCDLKNSRGINHCAGCADDIKANGLSKALMSEQDKQIVEFKNKSTVANLFTIIRDNDNSGDLNAMHELAVVLSGYLGEDK